MDARTHGQAHHAPPHHAVRRPWARRAKPVAGAVALAVALGAGVLGDGIVGPTATDISRGPVYGPSADEVPLSWGPTGVEVKQARRLVRGLSDEQLAGQVIVGRFHGTDPATAGRMVARLHLAGVSVTNENVTDADQVKATTAAVTKAVASDGRSYPPVIGVDEEGGSVEHLRGIATSFPPFQTAGKAISGNERKGERVVRDAARATALELRSLGFTWVFAPVADVTIGAGDPTIGDRSASEDPAVAAKAVTAAVQGYNAAGLVSTAKHFPGHGAVAGNTHEELAALKESRATIERRDLVPFRAAVSAGVPAVMVGHIDVKALAPGKPASMAAQTYDLLRSKDIGFHGLAITDSLGMGAVTTTTKRSAVVALKAGADLLLMPADARTAYRTVLEALRSGDLSRSRVRAAATKVVAMQLWQQQSAGGIKVPADVTDQAQQAAADLRSAAYGG